MPNAELNEVVTPPGAEEEMVIPADANVWEWKEKWYHRDETESIYGPFLTEALAMDAFTDYCDCVLEGKRPMIRPAQLAKLEEIWKLQDEVANDEEALKNKKALLALAEEHDLGELLTERELTNGVRLADGREFTFERKMHCGVNKDQRDAAYAFLDEAGADAILKRTLSISLGRDSKAAGNLLRVAVSAILPQYEVSVRAGKAPELLVAALRQILKDAGLTAEVEETVELPGASLRSWIVKRMKLGQSVPECFGVYSPMKAIMVPATVVESSEVAAS